MLLTYFAHTCNAIVINPDQQYFIKNNGGRGNCAGEGVAVFMAYYRNKTCNAGATGSTYGPTVGPVLSGAYNGKTSSMFTLEAVGKTAQNEILVEIKTSYPKSSKQKPLCSGYVVPEKKDECTVNAKAPLADKVHIHAQVGDKWVLFSVKGKPDTYTIRAYSRKAGCLKYLSAPAACAETYLQLEAKDDRSGRQHWTIIPVKAAAPPSPRKAPPPLAKFVEIPAVNYSIALTGYNSNSFGSSESTAFCDSILSSQTYPQAWMNCTVAFVSDVLFQGKSSGRRLMQGNSTAYVLCVWRRQQQAENAAGDLYKNMSSPTTLQSIMGPSFPSSTITPDAVNRGDVEVPQSTLPTTGGPPPSPSPSPSPSSPTPSSPTPKPSSPNLSPNFNTSLGVITDGLVTSSPAPSGGGGGGGGGGAPPATIPGVPTIGTFTANTGGVNAAWTAPASNGGAAISSYDILCTPNTGAAFSSPAISASVCTLGACSTVLTGLAGGSTYTCKVRATNSVGPSAYSGDSNSFVAQAAPGIPTIGTFTANTGSANAAWTAPSPATPAVTSYDIQCTDSVTPTPGVVTATGISASVCAVNACSTVMTGLTDGLIYTCKVQAVNSVGPSGYSIVASNSFVNPIVPGAPTIGTFTANTGGANAAWTAPTSNGGAVITSYNVLCTPNTGPAIPSTGISASVCTLGACSTVLTGFAGGSTYTCKVRATNSVGPSAYSCPYSNSFVKPIIPGVPTIGTCSLVVAMFTATVRWTAPASNGGAAITSYDIKCVDTYSPPNSATATATTSVCTLNSCSYIMTGLLSATTSTYTCKVRATNSVGSSAYSSASNSFSIPSGSPSAILGVGSTSGDRLGYAIDLSADANTAVIGTNGGNAAYVATRTGTNAWATKVPLENAPVTGEDYGVSVSASSDGSRIIVGAPGYFSGIGKVYIYTKSGSVWGFSTALTGSGGNFGVSVSISDDGNTIVAGANTQSYQTEANAGEVFVSTYLTGSWTALSSIAGGDTSADGCGKSVSISGDGQTIVYGCPAQNGKAYVMEKSGANWGTPIALAQYVTGGLASGGNFGASVAVSKDGSNLVVGAPASGIGEAYAFTRSGNSWANPIPTCFKLAGLNVPALTGTPNLGVSVSISGDSSTIGLGANHAASNAGNTFTYTKSGSSWQFFDYFNSPGSGSLFGQSVALSDTGRTFVFGGDGYSSNKGKAYSVEIF